MSEVSKKVNFTNIYKFSKIGWNKNLANTTAFTVVKTCQNSINARFPLHTSYSYTFPSMLHFPEDQDQHGIVANNLRLGLFQVSTECAEMVLMSDEIDKTNKTMMAPTHYPTCLPTCSSDLPATYRSIYLPSDSQHLMTRIYCWKIKFRMTIQ